MATATFLSSSVLSLFATMPCDMCGAMVSTDDLGECRGCEASICENCNCPCYSMPTAAELTRHASSARLHSQQVIGWELGSPYVVEDEYGGLLVFSGQPKNLLLAKPVLEAIFHSQLIDSSADYKNAQCAVGSGRLDETALILSTGQAAVIVSFVAKGIRFTATFFSVVSPV